MSTRSAIAWKTRCHTANTGRLLRRQSTFKIFFVAAFAVVFEFGLWALFDDGFRLLHRLGGVGVMLVSRLFALFFLAMGAMLVVSGIITAYSTIFRSREIPFLLTRPFTISEIVVYKFLESAGLSSWAFLFIVIPFAGAYAVRNAMTPWFALWTFLFSIPFLFLCAGIGTLVALILSRWSPARLFQRHLTWLLAAAAAGALWLLAHSFQGAASEFELNLSKLVPGLALADNRMLPSWWVAEGILSLSRGDWARGVLLWLALTSSAALIGMVIEWLGRHIFYDAWQQVEAGGNITRRRPVLLQRIERHSRFLPRDVAAMIFKDARTFLRDPMQWSQALIFFGLLAFYFANLRLFRYHALPEAWRNAIAFLNVFSVSAVICSLGSRFIYPQLSLEGQGFWILGLSPTTTDRILVTKFISALLPMLLISTALMMLSSTMLAAAWETRLLAVALSSTITLAVCAMSTGLGAIFLDLEQRNPAAIVSGFGGTLNLVLCLGFMLAAILPFGVVYHLHVAAGGSAQILRQGLWFAGLWLLVLTTAAAILPVWIGAKALRNRDY